MKKEKFMKYRLLIEKTFLREISIVIENLCDMKMEKTKL